MYLGALWFVFQMLDMRWRCSCWALSGTTCWPWTSWRSSTKRRLLTTRPPNHRERLSTKDCTPPTRLWWDTADGYLTLSVGLACNLQTNQQEALNQLPRGLTLRARADPPHYQLRVFLRAHLSFQFCRFDFKNGSVVRFEPTNFRSEGRRLPDWATSAEPLIQNLISL